MVTIKDIAKEAGVSTMMVSRVINKYYNQVSQKNIEKIQKIIDKYGYVPNSAAQSLSAKSSRIIAVFINGDSDVLKHPYNALMLGHLIEFIQKHNYEAMVYFIKDYSIVLEKLRGWKTQGAIFFGIFDQDMEEITRNTDVTLVFTDCYSSDFAFNNVGIDDYKGGMLAGEYLLKKGHRNFVYIEEPDDNSMVIRQRRKGFQSVLAIKGIELTEDRIIHGTTRENIEKMLADFAGEHLAVFAHSDLSAMSAIQFIRAAGYSVPEDVSIIGFDNLYIDDLIQPGLTSISQNIREKAMQTVNLLMQKIEMPQSPSQRIILDVSIVERESVKDLTQPEL